jgi:UDP:flavonoid glycosyltransferase YjiC (YdhE family)
MVSEMTNINASKKPLVAFLTMFDYMGETLPLLEIAKKYRELGGEAIFVGYGNKYEKLAAENGFKTIIIRRHYKIPILEMYKPDDFSDGQSKTSRKVLHQQHREEIIPEKKFYRLFNKKYEKDDMEAINKEIEIFKEEKVDVVITGFISTSLISAHFVKIPVIFLQSGVAIRPFFLSNNATFPENYENALTLLIPNFIKKLLTNWYIAGSNWRVGGFNRLAEKYGVPKLNYFLELFSGDYTLVADDIELLDVDPTEEFPAENFVGPILTDNPLGDKFIKFDMDIEQHIKRPGRSILLTMGSSPLWKDIFLRSLKALNQTDYNVIATYTSILNEDDLPKLNDNILLKKFIPNIAKLNQMVDLAIIHGGRGTVYPTAYSGKPAIGIALHSEQQHNLDNLVRKGMVVRVSKRYFDEKKLMNAVEKVFDNYDKYLKNAQAVKDKLPLPNGAEKAARRILEIWMHNSKNQ